MATIKIRMHPFDSPISHHLIAQLEQDLARMYPDWQDLPQPNYKGDPRPKSLQAAVPNPYDIAPSEEKGEVDVKGGADIEPIVSRGQAETTAGGPQVEVEADTNAEPPEPSNTSIKPTTASGPPRHTDPKAYSAFSDLIPTFGVSNTLDSDPRLTFFVAFHKQTSSSHPEAAPTVDRHWHDGEPAGCIALRLLFPHTSQPLDTSPATPVELERGVKYAEVKRLFVEQKYRRLGVSKQLLAFAEGYAKSVLKVQKLVLEVGLRQEAAVALYVSQGWVGRGMYGEYVGMGVEEGGDSICLEKTL